LSVIGAITVLAFLAGVAVLIYMAWSVYKCKRDEERAWQQERELMERGSAEDDTRPYPPGAMT
jgi:threonine/homoserine/homoserine lactone efflux protein